MRLINVKKYVLEEFTGSRIPRYAILSHTWGDREVSFKDMEKLYSDADRDSDVPSLNVRLRIKGEEKFMKIKMACQQALTDSHEYIWIDTCCIDKSSSAELSEAINSMYAWYRDAAVCYAYLEDLTVPSNSQVPQFSSFYEQFKGSRWFTRGWTLQELIAPRNVKFFSRNWVFVGNKEDLKPHISVSTGISNEYISGENVDEASIAERLSWASKRQTTRVEDEAYSLLGLLEVRMPLLYGEGTLAFRRLQEEITKSSDDQTIFAWGLESFMYFRGFLADSAKKFLHSNHIIRNATWQTPQAYLVTNRGLQITLYVLQFPERHGYIDLQDHIIVLVGCQDKTKPCSVLAVELEPAPNAAIKENQVVDYVRTKRPKFISYLDKPAPHVISRSIFIKDIGPQQPKASVRFGGFELNIKRTGGTKFKIIEVDPPEFWICMNYKIVGPVPESSIIEDEWCAVVRLKIDKPSDRPKFSNSKIAKDNRKRRADKDLALFLFRYPAQNRERVEIVAIPTSISLLDFRKDYLKKSIRSRGHKVFLNAVEIRPRLETGGRIGEKTTSMSLVLKKATNAKFIAKYGIDSISTQ